MPAALTPGSYSDYLIPLGEIPERGHLAVFEFPVRGGPFTAEELSTAEGMAVQADLLITAEERVQADLDASGRVMVPRQPQARMSPCGSKITVTCRAIPVPEPHPISTHDYLPRRH